jgi:hypothetical protein
MQPSKDAARTAASKSCANDPGRENHIMRLTMTLPALAMTALAGCESVGPTTVNDGALFDVSPELGSMVAGIWVDPEGCDHWIIDDGREGYASPRVTPDGRPVCRPDAVPNTSNVVRTWAGSR